MALLALWYIDMLLVLKLLENNVKSEKAVSDNKILRIKHSLANGIQLLDCWEDTMCVLLNVIHAI